MCLWTLQIRWTLRFGSKKHEPTLQKKQLDWLNFSHQPEGLERPPFSNKTTLPREVSPIRVGGAMASLRVEFFASQSSTGKKSHPVKSSPFRSSTQDGQCYPCNGLDHTKLSCPFTNETKLSLFSFVPRPTAHGVDRKGSLHCSCSSEWSADITDTN